MIHQAVHQAVEQAARAHPHSAPGPTAHMIRIDVKDLGIGSRECNYYARNRPGLARRNAENYAYFILNRRGHN